VAHTLTGRYVARSKMENITSNLHECKHCSGSGTCSSGGDSKSCLSCAKKADLPFWSRKNQQGLICGSCGGIGRAEPLTERMNKRIAPLLAIYLVVILLVFLILSAFTNNQYFSEILAFSSAIIGSVVGYYFSNRKAT
ncbi:hypothetical protein, partial [Vibrio harveyi]